MGVEIERKFLVDKSKLPVLHGGMDITQGYILNSPEKVVRVRKTSVRDAHRWGYITIKGKNSGAKRPEYEYDIPYEEAEEQLNTLCEEVIEKLRFRLEYMGHTWEIDFFKGSDLVVAEVELESEDEEVILPGWVNEEVTDDRRFYNSNLAGKSEKYLNSLNKTFEDLSDELNEELERL